MTKIERIKLLTITLMQRKCNDSCLYGKNVCKFQKRCDLLLTLKKKEQS